MQCAHLKTNLKMNYKILIKIISIFFLVSCEQNNINKKVINQKMFDKYKNTGFALVYTDILKKKKKLQKKLIVDLYLYFTKI